MNLVVWEKESLVVWEKKKSKTAATPCMEKQIEIAANQNLQDVTNSMSESKIHVLYNGN